MSKPKTIKQLESKLWKECRRIILDIYEKKDGSHECYTCGKQRLEKQNRQIGHFIPKSVCGAYLKYSLRNLRVQCYFCNINCGGNGAIFYKLLVEREGQEYIDQLFKDKERITKAHDHYEELIAKYTIV